MNVINDIINAIKYYCAMYFTTYAECEDLQADWSEARIRVELPIYDVDDYFIHWETFCQYNETCYMLCHYRHAIKHLYEALKAVSDEEYHVAKMVEAVEQSKNDHYPIRLGYIKGF